MPTESVRDVIDDMEREAESLLKDGEAFGFKRRIQRGNELMAWANRLDAVWRLEHGVVSVEVRDEAD